MKMGNACPELRDITPTLILPPQGGGDIDKAKTCNNKLVIAGFSFMLQ